MPVSQEKSVYKCPKCNRGFTLPTFPGNRSAICPSCSHQFAVTGTAPHLATQVLSPSTREPPQHAKMHDQTRTNIQLTKEAATKSAYWQNGLMFSVGLPTMICALLTWLSAAATEWDETAVGYAIAATLGGFATYMVVVCLGFIADRLNDIQGLLSEQKD